MYTGVAFEWRNKEIVIGKVKGKYRRGFSTSLPPPDLIKIGGGVGK
jgi:hypothetical protein